MNIRHKILEAIRQNPKAANEILKIKGGGLSFYRDWQLSTREYHQNGKNEAIVYLVNAIESHFNSSDKNRKKLEYYIKKLENYIVGYNNLGVTNVEQGKRIKMNIKISNFLTGEISRIDKKKDNYKVFLFIKEEYDWKNELRFPLLQYHYAKKYKVDVKKIKVGVYCLERDSHYSTSYSKVEIRNALDEVSNISNHVNSIIT